MSVYYSIILINSSGIIPDKTPKQYSVTLNKTICLEATNICFYENFMNGSGLGIKKVENSFINSSEHLQFV